RLIKLEYSSVLVGWHTNPAGLLITRKSSSSKITSNSFCTRRTEQMLSDRGGDFQSAGKQRVSQTPSSARTLSQTFPRTLSDLPNNSTKFAIKELESGLLGQASNILFAP